MPRRPAMVGAALGAITAAAGVACFAIVSVQGDSDAPSAESGVELHVEVRCASWTPENVELGVFVAGSQSDGSPCDMQLMFAGSGSQVAYVGEGSYEVVPQLPLLMTVDGSVFAASDALAFRYATGRSGSDEALVSYEEADARDLSEDELRDVAQASFISDEYAERALGRALAERGEDDEDE